MHKGLTCIYRTALVFLLSMVVARKPRGIVRNVLISQVKVFGDFQEPFFEKAS
jgi:hypothetical protein